MDIETISRTVEAITQHLDPDDALAWSQTCRLLREQVIKHETNATYKRRVENYLDRTFDACTEMHNWKLTYHLRVAHEEFYCSFLHFTGQEIKRCGQTRSHSRTRLDDIYLRVGNRGSLRSRDTI